MTYRFEADERVEDGVRRIALEQIDKALAEIAAPDLPVHETVHQVRKRSKKIRGLLRLVRPTLRGGQTFATENAWFRDAARELADLRDAQVLIDTVEKLVAGSDGALPPRVRAALGRSLAARRGHLTRRAHDAPERLAHFAARLGEGRARAAAWQLDGDGFEALAGGLARTYGRGRRAMAAARKTPSPEHFHEWRKRAKYGLYHHRLLHDVWPTEVEARHAALDRLSTVLGEHHDLALLDAAAPDLPAHTAAPLATLAHDRRTPLETEAFALGALLYAEKPRPFTTRIARYWTAWTERAP